MSLMKDLVDGLDQFALAAMTQNLTPDNRANMAERLKQWLVLEARKKHLPDLEERIRQFSDRINRLCANVQFETRNGEFVVKALGSDESTLRALEHGTGWFDPCDDV